MIHIYTLAAFLIMALMQSDSLPLGWEAPNFSLQDVKGQVHSLDGFEDHQGLLVVFTCNHCPYAKAAWPLLVELHQEFGEDIAFVAVNSNDESEYPEDGVEGMRKAIEEYGIEFPYLRDTDQSVAHDYEAQCTPDPYLFVKNEDGEFELFYHGRINDNWQEPDEVTERNLEEAMVKLINGEEPSEDWEPSIGCSIKWK